MLPDYTNPQITPPPFSDEAWERSNLTHMIRMQRSGKDDGERTPPIQQVLDAHVQVSNVAGSDAALPPSYLGVTLHPSKVP